MNVKEAIASILESTDEVTRVAEGLPEVVIRWQPAEDKWSILQILCHLEEAVPYWLHELQETVKDPQREWGRGLQHEGRLAAVAVAHEREVSDCLKGLSATKDQVKEVLGALRDEDLSLEAVSRNPRFGTKPLAFIVDHLLVEHFTKHLTQISRNIRVYEEAHRSN